MRKRKFDLNIEKILESWEIYHAIRELLANAIDEQIITSTKQIDVFKKDNSWIIRDYGRGIKYTALTQNENPEKLTNPHVIGKFGIGLKDALATLDRNKVYVRIRSQYNEITTEKLRKEGFEEIETLHAIVNEDVDTNFVGTEVTLLNLQDSDMDNARELFLLFSDTEVLSRSRYGDIIFKPKKSAGNIYINGVKVAEESNFLFSYNITNISTQIKKAINRERSNVGRTAYTDTVKKILLSSRDERVAFSLGEELEKINSGSSCDELGWIDIQEHAIRILNSTGKYVFLTSFEAITNSNMLDEANASGKTPLIIPDNLRMKIRGGTDFDGNSIMDLGQFEHEYNESFVFDFVEEQALSSREKKILSYTNSIVYLFGGLPKKVQGIKISNTMRKDFYEKGETLGCWDPKESNIVIYRKQLRSISAFGGTLIHELIHAKTNLGDVDREFESELTNQIGKILSVLLESSNAQV